MGKLRAKCLICGKEYKIYPYERGISIACSLVCQHEWQKKYRHGPLAANWKGGRIIKQSGYVFLYASNNPRAHNGYVPEQILIAEKAIGKYLPKGALVHHINGNRGDNRSSNLVICENNRYHTLVHVRTRRLMKITNERPKARGNKGLPSSIRERETKPDALAGQLTLKI